MRLLLALFLTGCTPAANRYWNPSNGLIPVQDVHCTGGMVIIPHADGRQLLDRDERYVTCNPRKVTR